MKYIRILDRGEKTIRVIEYRVPSKDETNWKSFAEYALTRLKSITIYQHQGCQKLWIHQPLRKTRVEQKFSSLSATYPRKNYSLHFSSENRDDNEINKLILS